jgi:hypothetical protein
MIVVALKISKETNNMVEVTFLLISVNFLLSEPSCHSYKIGRVRFYVMGSAGKISDTMIL